MSTSSTRGGGFFVGMFYGLIASTALFLVLSYLFPVEITMAPPASAMTAPESGAPEVMETASAETSTPDIGAGPVAPEMAAPQMAQPDVGENNNTSVGGAGDTSPTSGANTQMASNEAVSEPSVETAPASVPDIGNGAPETAAPSVETSAPTTPVEGTSNAPVVGAPGELAISDSGPALEVFAAAFSGDTSKPLMAIVLEDTGETSLQPLVETGKPFSFALPAGTDSSASAQVIRESGYEVVAMIPRGTNLNNISADNILQFMKNVPVAVALLDADIAPLMLDRASMQVILETTGPSGLGLISFSRNGELIARAQADEAGVIFGSALQITDDFTDEELIIQALNQAAFVAGTNDRAIVFAKTNEATVSGILRWLNSARAEQLELVPVSVALQRPAN